MDLLGLASGIIAAALWGGMYVVSKVVLDIVPPFTLLTMRLFLGALSLWPFVVQRGGVQFRRKQWLQVIGVGVVGFGISLGLQFTGTKLSTAANGSLVTSSTPAFVLIFAAILIGEKISFRRLVALGMSTVGVIVILDPRNARLSPQLFFGNLSLIGAALTWALYSVLVRKVTRGLAVLPVSFVVFLGGLLLTVPTSIVELQYIPIGTVNTSVIWGILYLGIVSTGLAMFLWNLAFARLEAGLASLTFFAQPVVGAGLGVLLLGENLTPLFVLGGVMIGIGLIIVAWEN